MAAPRVGINPLPRAETNVARPEQMFEYPLAGYMQSVAEGAARVADVEARAAEKARQRAQDARITNKVRELKRRVNDLTLGDEGYARLKGRDALDRPSGESLVDEYYRAFEEWSSSNGEDLSTPYEQEQYRQRAADIGLKFEQSLQSHLAEEELNFEVGELQGVIELSDTNMRLYNNDPQRVLQEQANAEGAIVALADLTGAPVTQTAAQLAGMRARAHSANLDSMMAARDYRRADAYLQQMGDNVPPGVRAGYGARINRELARERAVGVASQVVPTSLPSLSDGYQAGVLNLMAELENGGVSFDAMLGDEGLMAEKVATTSPAGAMGPFQIMPQVAKAHAQQMGLEYTEELGRSPHFQTQVAMREVAQHMRNWSTPEEILAAWNWGHGNLEAAQRQYGADWMQHAPAETVAFIQRGRAGMGRLMSMQTAAPIDRVPSLVEAQTAFEEMADREGMPIEARQVGRAEIAYRHGRLRAAQAEIEQPVLSQYHQLVEMQNFTHQDAVAVLGEQWNQLSAEARTSLLQRADPSPAFQVSSAKTANYLMENPDVLQNADPTTIEQYRRQVLPSDWNMVTRSVLAGPDDDREKKASAPQVLEAAKRAMGVGGMKVGDLEDETQLRIRRLTSLLSTIAENNPGMDLGAAAQEAMMTGFEVERVSWLGRRRTERLGVLDDLPDELIEEVEAEMEDRGVFSPTQEQIESEARLLLFQRGLNTEG